MRTLGAEDDTPLGSIQQPRRTGRHVRLRPVSQADYEFLYDLAVAEGTGYRWRYRGATPSPEEFVGALWRNVLAQFICESLDGSRRLGHLAVHDPDFANGVAFVSICFTPDAWGLGWPLEGAALFAELVFGSWNFRKLYAEVLEFNADQFRSAIGRLLVLEGRYAQRFYFQDRYWDQLILSLDRTTWASYRRRLLPEALTG